MLVPDGNCFFERPQRLCRMAGPALQGADAVVARGQVVPGLGDGGIVVGQLLADRQAPLERPQRLGRMAGRYLQEADAAVARGQVVPGLGVGGVVVGQLLVDRQRRSYDRSASAGWPVALCRRPMLLWLAARLFWNSVTEGLSSASFWRIASARSYDRSASAEWPVAICRMPMLLWLAARLFWNSVTEGLSSASFWRIASARSYDRIASAGWPVALCRRPMLLWLAARLFWNSVTEGLSSASFWRIASARSYDRSASAGGRSRLQVADVVVARGQVVPELGDGRIVVGQLLADRQRPLVRPQRLGRMAGRALQGADVVVALRPGCSGTR